jgi:hypothetical protein
MRNRAIDRDVIEAEAGTHAEVRHVIEHAGRSGSAGKLDVTPEEVEVPGMLTLSGRPHVERAAGVP